VVIVGTVIFDSIAPKRQLLQCGDLEAIGRTVDIPGVRSKPRF